MKWGDIARCAITAAVLLLSGGAPLARAEESRAAAIGALMPLTGEFAMQAQAFRAGMLLAVEELNAAKDAAGGQPPNDAELPRDRREATAPEGSSARSLPLDVPRVVPRQTPATSTGHPRTVA